MDNQKRYNIFILLSTISRNIVELFSSVLLYQIGYSFRNILIFYIILYLVGAFTSIITMYLTNKIKINILLIISSIIFSISFYYMSVMKNSFSNLIIFSIIYSIGTYSYHTIRHYLAIQSINNKRKYIGNILIYTNIAIGISSLLGSIIQSKLSTLILSILISVISLIGIIPLIKFKELKESKIIKYHKLPINKLIFFILEQAKVSFLSLQPLYLYLFISSKIEYIGVFNIIMVLSSIIYIYYFVRKIDDKKYFKYINIIFCIILLLKININNKYLILLISLFEGIGIKSFEIVSSENIYNIRKNINKKGYIIMSEVVFCLSNIIIYIISYIINDLKITMYILIITILFISFIKRNDN